MALFNCSACNRHVRAGETGCPFCGALAAVPEGERPQPTARLSRAAILAFAAATVGTGCGGRTTDRGSPSDAGNGGAAAGGAANGLGGKSGTGGAFGSGGGTSQGYGGFNVAPPYGGFPPPPGSGGAIGIPPYGAPFPFGGGGAPFGSGGGTSVGSGGANGSGGTLVDGGAPEDAAADASGPGCLNLVSGIIAKCCAEQALDCTNKPDGYPGFVCVPPPQSHCACSCRSGTWFCAC